MVADVTLVLALSLAKKGDDDELEQGEGDQLHQ